MFSIKTENLSTKNRICGWISGEGNAGVSECEDRCGKLRLIYVTGSIALSRVNIKAGNVVMLVLLTVLVMLEPESAGAL